MAAVMLLAAILTQSQVATMSSGRTGEAATLIHALEGKWGCVGAFANGKALEADLSFRGNPNGTSLQYRHVDRAPNIFRQEAQWGLDKSGVLVSLAFSGAASDTVPNAAFYVAEDWTAAAVTFVQKRLLSDPFAPNRFTYSVDGNGLRMVWEVNRDGAGWKMGDYLNCKRTAD